MAKDIIISLLISSGLFSGSVGWEVNDLGLDALGGKIAFKARTCQQYELIQAAKVLDNQDQVYKWKSGESNRNAITTNSGWFMDHLASKCSPKQSCSSYYKDHWPSGGQSGTKDQSAKIEDYPFGWTEFKQISLETCALCLDNNTFLGCVTWGGSFPVIGDKTIIPVVAKERPSKNFTEAIDKFKSFYHP